LISFRRFVRPAEGQDLIEYGLLIGMITVAIAFSIKDTGATVADLYADTVSVLSHGGSADPAGEPEDPAPAGGAPGNGNPGNGNPDPGNPGNGNPGNGNPVGNPGQGNPGGGKGM
jgi:Flp pilus assembly pilin Flp